MGRPKKAAAPAEAPEAKAGKPEQSSAGPEAGEVELFGLAQVKRGAWAVVKVTVEGDRVTEREVLFDPEPKEDAFQNLKGALVVHHYGQGVTR